MRRFAALVLIGLMAAQSAMAAPPETKGKSGGVPVFGFRNCEPTFQCPNTYSRERNGDMTGQIINIANACTRTFLGVRTPGGSYEEAYGLDASNCLTTKKIEPDATGLALTPKCCVTPTDSSGATCQVSCTLYGVKK